MDIAITAYFKLRLAKLKHWKYNVEFQQETKVKMQSIIQEHLDKAAAIAYTDDVI